MRVLLLSPLPGIDPANGDVTYTELLLAGPPTGVEYVDYAQALSEGSLVELRTRADVQARRGVQKMKALGATGVTNVVNRLRRRELLFREPVRSFQVQPGAFDLVHSHVFSLRCLGSWPPLLLGNSVPVEALYRDGLAWGAGHARAAIWAERAMATSFGVSHTTYRRGSAQHLLAFTEHLAQWWVDNGVARREEISVVPCFVASRALRPAKDVPRVLGLIANDPRVKGLDRALAVLQRVRQVRTDVELWVVGRDQEGFSDVASAPGVRWVGRVPRDVLLDDLLPQIDVMLHPTRFDGLPLSVLEVMAAGVPVVTTSYRALPEIVGAGGLAGSDTASLSSAVLELLDPGTNRRVGEEAQARQRACYSPEAVLPKLRQVYEDVLSARSSAQRN